MLKVNLELSKFHIDCKYEMEKLDYSGIYFVYLGYATDKKEINLKKDYLCRRVNRYS
jgi:hypothetical protein